MSWLRWQHSLALLISGGLHVALIAWFQQHPPPAVASPQTLLVQLIPRSWAEQLQLSTLPLPPPKITELLPEDDAAPGMLLAGARPKPPPSPPPPKPEVQKTPKVEASMLRPVVQKAPEPTPPPKKLEQPAPKSETPTALSLSQILQELPTESAKPPKSEAPATEVALPDSLLSDLELVALDSPEDQQVSLAARRMSVAESRIYRTRLIAYLAEHWEVPPHLADQDMVVEVRFVIERSGTIETGEVLKKSGNRFLDRSVQKVLDSLPFLPPVPDSYPDSRYEFFLGFNPSTFPL
ncbi:MAG: TonB family protein [SAR324 cluster bacterium]|nr:TonB family protein [SAR324 cluster bacterium]